MEIKTLPDIGKNILLLRKNKNLSLNELAKISSVSKAMINQIEKGTTNPTVSILWKIAKALDVPFQKVIEPESNELFEILKSNEIPIIYSKDHSCKIKVLNPIHFIDKIELYLLTFDPKGKLESDGHFDGTEEILSILSGNFKIKVPDKSAEISKGDSIRYKADTSHNIINMDNKQGECILMVKYI